MTRPKFEVTQGLRTAPLEVLIFLNDVRSATLYAQMKGRGCRTISSAQLQSVTPNADSKELFYIIDAVGVTESEKTVPAIGEKDRTVTPTLAQLFEKMAVGNLPDDYLQLLATKLNCIGHRADPEDLRELSEVLPEGPLHWADLIFTRLEKQDLPPFVSVDEPNTERRKLLHELLTNISGRKKLVEIARGYVKEIVGKPDEVTYAGFTQEEAAASTNAFEAYVTEHCDEVEALRLIYNQESGKLTRSIIDGLAKHLADALPGFAVGRLWNDYALLNPEKVKPLGDVQAVTNLIQLVRFAYKQSNTLYTLTSTSASRFELWCGQTQRGITGAKKELFRRIASYIAQNGSSDFQRLRSVIPDLALGLRRYYDNPTAANQAIYSLNEFILKAA